MPNDAQPETLLSLIAEALRDGGLEESAPYVTQALELLDVSLNAEGTDIIESAFAAAEAWDAAKTIHSEYSS